MIKLIEKDPPPATGNAQADLQALEDYLAYLKEQLNFILTNLQRGQSSGS